MQLWAESMLNLVISFTQTAHIQQIFNLSYKQQV